MIAGPHGSDPQTGSGCNGALVFDFGSAIKCLEGEKKKRLGPQKSHSQAVVSLAEGGEVKTPP